LCLNTNALLLVFLGVKSFIFTGIRIVNTNQCFFLFFIPLKIGHFLMKSKLECVKSPYQATDLLYKGLKAKTPPF